MMRSGENNHRVHDGYGKEMAPSSNVNDTDEDTDKDESNNYIMHDSFDEPSLDNLVMEVSESECNIVNETSSQSDSLTMLHFYSLNSITRFSDEGLSKGSCTMELFDSSSSLSLSVSLMSDDGAISFS